jgi:hypothetical protein
MHRWQDEDGGDGSARRRFSLGRVIVGQAVIVAVIGGALIARVVLPMASPPTTASQAPAQPTPLAATSISARPLSEVPEELSETGRRFLSSLARGDTANARRDIAASATTASLSEARIGNASAALQSARARGFRVLFWQPSETGATAITIAFDYDRPDTGEGRSRVTLRVAQQSGRWYIVDLDVGQWMTDLGLGGQSFRN